MPEAIWFELCGHGRFVQDGHTEKLHIDGPIVRLNNRLLHDDRKSLERWLQSQSRYQAQEAEKLTTRPWSELSWPDRLRRTRDALLPGGALQERGLGLIGALARHGAPLIDELAERMDVFAEGHQVMFL